MWYGRTTVPKSTSYIGHALAILMAIKWQAWKTGNGRSCCYDIIITDVTTFDLVTDHVIGWLHETGGVLLLRSKYVCVFLNDCGSEPMYSVSDVYMCVLLTNETYSMHWHPLRYSVYTYFCVRRCYIVMQMSAKLCTVLSLDEWMDRHVCL